MYLLSGGAEVIEVQADPGCRAEGRTVEDANARAATQITAIVREGRVIMPKGTERLEANDRLVAFNARHGVAQLRKAFDAAA
jgi:trk system potassium uptake protein TrkA